MLWILHKSGPSVSLNWVTGVQRWGRYAAQWAGQTHIHTHKGESWRPFSVLPEKKKKVGAPGEGKMWDSTSDVRGCKKMSFFTQTPQLFFAVNTVTSAPRRQLQTWCDSLPFSACQFFHTDMFLIFFFFFCTELSRSSASGACAWAA